MNADIRSRKTCWIDVVFFIRVYLRSSAANLLLRESTMKITRSPLLCLFSILLALSSAADGQEAGDKTGLIENFDTMDGWKKIVFPGEDAPLKVMKSEDGVGLFVTHPAPLGSFRTNPKWHDGMDAYDAFSNVARDWPELDLDKYRYLVMKIDEKACPASVIVNHVDLPVAYTTGVRAVDLSLYEDLKGRKPIEFRLQFLNTGGQVKIDWLKFVSELTPEEAKALIPPGLVLRPENLKGDPTQGLDTVMKRADRPRLDAAPAERLCFRDTATGAVIWRMTGLQSGATVVSDSARSTFNSSGSHMLILGRPGGPQLYNCLEDTSSPMRYAGISRFSPKNTSLLWAIEKTRRPVGIRFHRIDIATGLDEIAGEIQFDPKKFHSSVTDLGFSSETDRIAVGLRGTPYAFLLDPAKSQMSERVRMITLPMRLKGMGLSPDGKRLFWHRCYWYESWQMDLESGEITRAMRHGGSHAGGGGGLTLAHYQGAIIAAPEGLTDPDPGDRIKIMLNYQQGWHTDYGHLSSDRLWYIANGSAGDMKNQLVMASATEPGSVLRIAFQNTSRNSWYNNTVIRSSPDYTKLTWVSDIWGYNAVCVAYTRRPEAPYRFSGKRDGNSAVIRWEPSRVGNRGARETAGYNLYRSTDGGPFLRLNERLLKAGSYRDEDLDPGKVYRYILSAQEYSGLEGTPSNECVIPPAAQDRSAHISYTLHLEAEHGTAGPPARQAFDGWASGWRYVRIRKQLETEDAGLVQWDVHAQSTGDYSLWLRTRSGDEAGKWQVSVDYKPAGEVPVVGGDWQWVRFGSPVSFEAGKRRRVRLTSSDDGLAIDKVILTTDRKYVPTGLDDRFSVPPKKLEYLVAKKVTQSSVHLAWWNPQAEPDLAYYNVYVGEAPDFPTDQAHLIASTRKLEALDWGLPPGKTYTYKVVAVNRRGLVSEPAVITVQTLPVQQKVVLELSIDAAKLDARLKKETRGGVKYAYRPFEGAGHENDPPSDITWEFDLPVAGNFMIWSQYAPADYGSYMFKIPVLLDDFLDGKAIWRMRTPYRAMKGPNYRLWKEDLWFVDKVSMYVWPKPRDFFKLAAGQHKLTLRMSPKMKEFHHKIGKVWITNDPSFRPPGWDPQADFKKAKIVRK